MDEIEIIDKHTGKTKFLIVGDEVYEYRGGKKIRRKDLEVKEVQKDSHLKGIYFHP